MSNIILFLRYFFSRSHGNFHLDYNEIKKLTSLNTQLNKRVQEVIAERESVLQDAQDLLNGMQVEKIFQ